LTTEDGHQAITLKANYEHVLRWANN